MATQVIKQPQNVVSLLQKLEHELLESLPSHTRQNVAAGQQQPEPIMAMSAKKLVQKRLDLHSQFEEIEGSQERSPYMVRHMHVQRQNWIKIEDSKDTFGVRMPALNEVKQSSHSDYSSGGNMADVDISDNQLPIAVQSSELAKKRLEDTDVNVTNITSTLIGDTSSHLIQRPLPVNRIQQKIAKDRTFGLDHHHHHRAPRPSPEKNSNSLLLDMTSPQKKNRSQSRGRRQAASNGSSNNTSAKEKHLTV